MASFYRRGGWLTAEPRCESRELGEAMKRAGLETPDIASKVRLKDRNAFDRLYF